MPENETVLLEQYVRTRDAFAFRELVEQHQDMVFAACHRVLGNRVDAEDASQNCFLKFSQAAGRLRSPIAGWLHTVAVQGSIDILRGRIARRERERVVAVHADQVQPGASVWDDVRGEVDAAIVALPERLRTPLVLYFLERRTQADVAAELGITATSVSRRLRRAVEALRRRLKRAGVMTSVAALPTMLFGGTAEAAPATLAANLGKVVLAGTGSAKVAAVTAGGASAALKVAATIVVAAAAGAGAVIVHHAGKPPHPAPVAAAAVPAPPVAKEAPKATKAPLTPEAVLNAELTLTSTMMRLWELAKLVENQIGVDVAYESGYSLVPFLEPGKHKVRDVLAVIDKSMPLTTEVLAARDRVVICLWRKPDAELLADMMKLATSDDAVERCAGARWLDEVGGRDAFVQLLKMLPDPDMRVRYFASDAVAGGWRHAVPCLAPKGTSLVVANAIMTETWPATRGALFCIARSLRDPDVLPVFERLLRKQVEGGAGADPGTISSICGVIAVTGGPKAEAVLLAAMDELPERHTDKAIYALSELGTDKALARLSKQIDIMQRRGDQRDPYYRLIDALGDSGNPAAVPALKRIVNLPGVKQREAYSAMRCMAKLGSPEAQAACLARFRSATDEDERWFMASVPAVQDVLFAELGQGGVVARRAALTLVEFAPDPRLVPVLVELLETDDETLRMDGAGPDCKKYAIEMLGHIGTPEVEKVLIPLAESDDPLRNAALRSLGCSSSPEVRKMLRAALKHEDPDMCSAAATALAERPDPADIDLLLASLRTVIAKLPEARQDKNPWFRVWKAVAKIGGEQAARELVAEVARGDATLVAEDPKFAPLWLVNSSHSAAVRLVSSDDPHCVKAVRDALAGDDVNLRAMLMSAFNTGGMQHLGGQYAVSVALAKLPGADEQLKIKRAKLLGWTLDPRAIDALGKLLVNAKEPASVRRAAIEGILFHHTGGGYIADPAAVEPLRHALEHDPDIAIKKLAKGALMRWGVIPFEAPERPVHPDGEREVVPNPLPDP